MRAIHCTHRKEHRRFARVLSRSESFSKLTTKICTPPIRDESGNKISAKKKRASLDATRTSATASTHGCSRHFLRVI
jgi:hypothetical protein